MIRVRPANDTDDTAIKLYTDKVVLLGKNTEDADKEFVFQNIFPPDTTQETFYKAVGKEIVEGSIAGYNGTILAYGQVHRLEDRVRKNSYYIWWNENDTKY